MATVVTPATIAGGDNPFPPGKWHLVVVRGTLAGCQLMSHFYAVRHLPLSDVMMLASIKPVSGTLLARLVLKEAVGVAEVVNLVLVVTGLCLVVQPSFVFGDTGQQYDQHMMLTALAVVVANALGGGIGVIIRYLRAMHWAALAVTTRIFTVLELSVAAAVLGLYCVPACGLDRWGIVVVAVAGSLTQMLFIFGLKVSASKSSILRFVITEKAPTRAFSWLKAATSAFTFKALLRRYAKWALTPRSLNMKLGS